MRPIYNERSWAIEVITCLNQLLAWKRRIIPRAGGEHGVSVGEHRPRLFPDVLLFGSVY